MLLKNRDNFPSDLQKLINLSELKFLQKIFQKEEENNNFDDNGQNNEFCGNEEKENGNIEFKEIKGIKQNTQCTIIRRVIYF